MSSEQEQIAQLQESVRALKEIIMALMKINREEYNLLYGLALGWTYQCTLKESGQVMGTDPQGQFAVWPDFYEEDMERRAKGFIKSRA